jgi:hypothetical protein
MVDQIHFNPQVSKQNEEREHLAAFDQAMRLLNKYNHGRCDIYRTEDMVYFICKKPVL